MAVRPSKPQRGTTAATAAAFVLAGWFAAPVLAAPDHDLLCDESHDATLEISERELSATPVNTSEELLENHLLKPRVEATAREVFSDVEESTDADDSNEAESDDAPVEAVIQSVPNAEMLRMKRQMYRRDI
jgi:hypothetical protein